MQDKKIKIFLLVVGLLILGVIALAFMREGDTGPKEPGKYDALAMCLKDKGAVFYGAYWCVHCKATKKLFGSSAKLLPYVECSTADGNSQLQICKDKKIEGYPTWEFSDGSRMSGELSLETLASKTSCELPK
jgi:thiol-disulfide isomerase/thioredoxin